LVFVHAIWYLKRFGKMTQLFGKKSYHFGTYLCKDLVLRQLTNYNDLVTIQQKIWLVNF
jgi:hypothetical protein